MHPICYSFILSLLVLSLELSPVYAQASLGGGDSGDQLALSLLLKKKRFSPQYAQNKLSIGKTIEEPYITEGSSHVINKSFLSFIDTNRFRYWKKSFLKNQAHRAKALLKKGLPYKQVVENIFMYHNLPKELYYVGLIESRYELRIKSPAGARGPWQFLAATARDYGLIVNQHYDERTNLVKATHAAAEYFKDLYNIFGSWELALSAYNAGEYGIIRKIRRARTRDFYQLSRKKILPKETRNYIPKVLALIEIDSHQRQYGFRLKKPVHPLGKYENTYVVALKKSRKLKTIAQQTGLSLEQIRKLNPELRGSYTPSPIKGKTYRLRLSRPRNQRVIASAPVKGLKKVSRKLPRFHRLASGENLSVVAKKYDLPLAKVLMLNHHLEGKTLFPGEKIRLISQKGLKKSSRNKRPQSAKVANVSRRPKRKIKTISKKYQVFASHQVKKGESLSSISSLFNVKIAKIKSFNALKNSKLKLGQWIKIPGVRKKVHIVKKGEFLKKIANHYKTSIDTIQRLNELQKFTVYPGQKLVVIN